MNDFIATRDRKGEAMLGLSKTILAKISEYNLNEETLLGEELYPDYWGYHLDDWPIDEENRYRWMHFTADDDIVEQVNSLRNKIAIAEQTYFKEFNRKVTVL